MNNNILRSIKVLVSICVVVLVILIALVGSIYFANTHFLFGTTIDNVDCSFLKLEQAIEKINLEEGEKVVTFRFNDDKTYYLALKQFGVQVDKTRVAQIFEQQHSNFKELREYKLDGYIIVDEKMLMEVLKQIPELQEENMVYPKDAYAIWDEVEFSIQKEELGNVIDFDEAVELAISKIKNNEGKIDFSPITDVTPEIFTEDLADEVDSLNSILKSSINFELSNGNTVTLNSNIIKNWVYEDENAKFAFDVERGVSEFVEELAIMVNDANSNMQFLAADSEKIATVNVPKEVRAQLDKESEIAEIKNLLGNSEPINTKLIYDRPLVSDKLASHIEIDISRQHVWFYLNGELLVDTACVTGNVSEGHDTPTGVFYLLNKNLEVYLEGYNNDGSKYSSFVEYWMRFNGGIGLHDASWRSKFGGEIYLTNGSHGCINLPKDKAAQFYEAIDETMPIIVYKSGL